MLTKGKGLKLSRIPYEARYNNVYRNVHVRRVGQLMIVSRFFNYSKKVDLHNHGRQGNLNLEECWVTRDADFLFFTTIIEMCVRDFWKLE